jgi:hypothetical protein
MKYMGNYITFTMSKFDGIDPEIEVNLRTLTRPSPQTIDRGFWITAIAEGKGCDRSIILSIISLAPN